MPTLQSLQSLGTRLDFYFSQARERLTSYRGRMMAKVCWQINDGPVEVEMRDCGLLPIMVRVSTVIFSYYETVLSLPAVRALQFARNVFR